MIRTKELLQQLNQDEEYQNYLVFSYLNNFNEQSDIKTSLQKNNGLKRLKTDKQKYGTECRNKD